MGIEKTVKIEMEFPASVVEWMQIPAYELASELKKFLGIYLYGKGRLTLQQACDLAGMTKWEFFELNADLRIPVPYDLEELAQDRKNLEELGV
jgi:predicted HTH domain antitoxin